MWSTTRFFIAIAAVCFWAGCPSSEDGLTSAPDESGRAGLDASAAGTGGGDPIGDAGGSTDTTGQDRSGGLDTGSAVTGGVDAAGDRSDGADVVLDDAAGFDVVDIVDIVDLGTIDMTPDGGPMAYDAGLICCSGLDPRCDGTKLPSGDGTSPGQFTVSADDPTVTDTITGLVWQREGLGARPGCTGGTTCTWDEAQSYCSGLSLGGATDWRLPSVKELRSIVDFTQAPVALDPIAFPHTSTSYIFWTANPSAESVNNAWGVLLGNGSYSQFRRIDSYSVRCVRAPRCAPAARYVVLEDGLVRDEITQRVWQRDGAGSRTGCTGTVERTCTWAEARSYCETLVLGGFDDFRLPTAKEMDSLVDFAVPPMGPTIDGAAFPNTPTDPTTDKFWSSTTYEGHAWCTYFYDGSSLAYDLTDYGRVRCVR